MVKGQNPLLPTQRKPLVKPHSFLLPPAIKGPTTHDDTTRQEAHLRTAQKLDGSPATYLAPTKVAQTHQTAASPHWHSCTESQSTCGQWQQRVLGCLQAMLSPASTQPVSVSDRLTHSIYRVESPFKQRRSVRPVLENFVPSRSSRRVTRIPFGVT